MMKTLLLAAVMSSSLAVVLSPNEKPGVYMGNFISPNLTALADKIYDDSMNKKDYSYSEPFVGCTSNGNIVVVNIATNVIHWRAFKHLCDDVTEEGNPL